MEKEKLPIKFFAPREIDELRVEGAGTSEQPKWVLTGEALVERSSQLLFSFSQFTDDVANREKRNSAVPFVFIAKLGEDSTAKSRRKDIHALFQTSDKSSVIGLAKTDELIVKLDSISQMNEISSKLQNYQQNSYAISCLKTFKEFQPYIEFDDIDSSYKVKLIDFQDYETNISMQRLFERTMTAKRIEYKKTYYAGQMPIYKISKSSATALDGLRNEDIYEMLLSIEPMPKYVISFDSFLDDGEVDIQKPIDGERYETLGILDNGIAPIPHLLPWMADKRWSVYPKSVITPTHGTFVAGVALYGDACENKEWVGHRGIKLFDATVFPDTKKEGLEEDDLIANIREAIAQNHEQVKIWNLSISITRPVVDSKFSDLAIALDDLQGKFNVLICKSAGNCSNFLSGKSKGRIHEGADSVRSLVVGSIAHKKSPDDFSEIDNPSPFSRMGPGPEYIIKPEVSHYGGNAGVDVNGELTTTGVKSFDMNGNLSRNVGTSFSTPRIAALATGLYQELDEKFDPLLLKSLIVHSASYSEKLKIPEAERTKQIGFGIPKNVTDILYNAPYEATLILRDTLSKGEKIDIMDFPMPKSLIKNGYYTGQIIATLVYDPILDPSQGIEYCQSNIDMKFGSYDAKKERDISKRHILNPVGRDGAQNIFRESLYSKRLMRDSNGEFALRERLLIQYGDKYYPVKKYAVDLSELSEASKQHFATPDKLWYLYLQGLYRDHTEQRAILERFVPSQEFCLIITIRDPDRQANVYDEVTQGLDAYNFWHSNIKISSEVSSRLNP